MVVVFTNVVIRVPFLLNNCVKYHNGELIRSAKPLVTKGSRGTDRSVSGR